MKNYRQALDLFFLPGAAAILIWHRFPSPFWTRPPRLATRGSGRALSHNSTL